MQKLNLPEYIFRYRSYQSRQQIFDAVRKKYVAFSPEEWVRQNFVAWLINERHYPAGLIAIEKELLVNKLKKRYDIVIYNCKHIPSILVECKAPGIAVSQKVFEQAARYNLALKVSYLIVTNGITHYCCYIDVENGTYSFQEHIPFYEELF